MNLPSIRRLAALLRLNASQDQPAEVPSTEGVGLQREYVCAGCRNKRKSLHQVHAGRARTRNASRDEQGRFVRFRATILAFVAIAVVPATAFCTDIGKIPWTEANIEMLRTFDKAAIMQFADSNGQTGTDFYDFSWSDLAGNGRYALVLHGSPGVRRIVMIIYQQDDTGKIGIQQFDGDGLLKDVNSDGAQELIIPRPLPHPDWGSPVAITAIFCPRVFRLETGKYVEASAEFASYYDAEVLPPIENAISKMRLRLANGPIGSKPTVRWLRFVHRELAGITMQRDKILRVIGRDPEAGLQEAREWMNNSDPVLVQDAATVFADIGGHEADLRAANSALQAATDRQPGPLRGN